MPIDTNLVNEALNKGTEGINTVSQQVNKINWSAPTWDLFIFVFFVALVFLFIFSLNRDKIFITILGVYIIIGLLNLVPILRDWYFKEDNVFFVWKIVLFLALTASFSALLGRVVSLQLRGGVVFFVILSILQAGLLLSLILSFVPLDIVKYLSKFTQNVFLSDFGKLGWDILPILGVLFIRKKI